MYRRSKYFNMYFNEEGEEMMAQDPNQMGDSSMMQQPSPPPPVMLDPEETDSKTDKKFPIENDGTTPEQDLANFTNYQRLLYFEKFYKLLRLIDKIKMALNNSKLYVNFDEINNEKQHKIIKLLVSSLEETKEQINFFMNKGISSCNIDKTRAIFNAIVIKLDTILNTFHDLQKSLKIGEEDKGNNKNNLERR